MMEGSAAGSGPLTNGSGTLVIGQYLRSIIHTPTGMHYQGGGHNFRARICKPFVETRNRFQAWCAGTTTLFVVPARQATNTSSFPVIFFMSKNPGM
jgi:hypothetical protein